MAQVGLDVFFNEAHDLIQVLETRLLDVEANGLQNDDVHVLFRAVHTIKGSGGLFGFEALIKFCHVVENTLDLARNGKWDFSSEHISALLKCTDHIRSLIDRLESTEQISPELERAGDAILALLGTYHQEPQIPTISLPVTHESWADQACVKCDHWHLSLSFGTDLLRCGLDPSSFLVYLKKMGQVLHVKSLLPQLNWSDYQAEDCYLNTEIALKSDSSLDEIRDVFEFIADDSQLYFIPPHAPMHVYQEIAAVHPLGIEWFQLLVNFGSLSETESQCLLADNFGIQAEIVPETIFGNDLIPSVSSSATLPNSIVEKRALESKQFIKIESNKLDSLINLVGELVIAGAGAKLTAQKNQLTVMNEAIEGVAKLVDQIRDSSLGLRMVPVGEVFQRFPRVVRDVSKELNKEIVLEIFGADTELDKSMVEKLTDPLTHMIRNAMDHGIEATDQRIAKGKDPIGHLVLNAYHDSGSVVIEIEDDGGGIRKDVILAKAIEKGIVSPEDHLDEQATFALIFAPGFSTAEKVTNLSGRGVGMDVVKQSIQQLRGQIEIESEVDVGTLFRIRLPLTLAIMDVFQVQVGQSQFVFPLEFVHECAKLKTTKGHHHNDFMDLRGEPLPLIDLGHFLKIPAIETLGNIKNVVVIQHANHRIGLVVDRLWGQGQSVIKPLNEVFKKIHLFSGSTVLGDGSVAFMLDINEVIAMRHKKDEMSNNGSIKPKEFV